MHATAYTYAAYILHISPLFWLSLLFSSVSILCSLCILLFNKDLRREFIFESKILFCSFCTPSDHVWTQVHGIILCSMLSYRVPRGNVSNKSARELFQFLNCPMISSLLNGHLLPPMQTNINITENNHRKSCLIMTWVTSIIAPLPTASAYHLTR